MKIKIVNLVATGLVALMMTSTAPYAQSQPEAQQNAVAIANQIKTLMEDMEVRAQGFPELLTALAEGRATIEQADQTVADLIEQLTEITTQMEDGTEFDVAIDGYVEATQGLIAEAEASNNDAMKGLIPSLKVTKESLETDDARRAALVVRSRNVIRELEKNREAIAFFIKAGAVTQAAELIRGSVNDFEGIVERGQAVAQGLIDASTN